MKAKRTMPKKRTMRLHIKCPNCTAPTIAYKVTSKSYSLTELTCECSNELCKMTFVAFVEVNRILQMPIIMINPGMQIPVSQLVRTPRMVETMGMLDVSNDESDLELIDEAMPQGDLFYSPKAANDSS